MSNVPPAKQVIVLAHNLIPAMPYDWYSYNTDAQKKERMVAHEKLELIRTLCWITPKLFGHSIETEAAKDYPLRYVLGSHILNERQHFHKEALGGMRYCRENGLWFPNSLYCGHCGELRNCHNNHFNLDDLKKSPASCFYFHRTFIVVHSNVLSRWEKTILSAIRKQAEHAIFIPESFISEGKHVRRLLEDLEQSKQLKRGIDVRYQQLAENEKQEERRRLTELLNERVSEMTRDLLKS